MAHGRRAHGDVMLEAAVGLAVDAAARQLCLAFTRAGVDAILLKGATLADWLYNEGELRTYGDVDLLVQADQVGAAERVLRENGFRTGSGEAPPEAPHARAWRHPDDGRVVDLHWTISGSCVGPAETFAVLSDYTRRLSVGGGPVRALDRTAAALLVVLHASQHAEGKPLQDLARLIERLNADEWAGVRRLSERLRADYGLGHGLRLLPHGEKIAERMALLPPELLNAARRPHASLVLGFERLRRARGWRARGELLLTELVPGQEFMRWHFPLARRGRSGLLAARCWRALSLAWRLPSSLRAWHRLTRPPT